jgi:hypothetical protein
MVVNVGRKYLGYGYLVYVALPLSTIAYQAIVVTVMPFTRYASGDNSSPCITIIF